MTTAEPFTSGMNINYLLFFLRHQSLVCGLLFRVFEVSVAKTGEKDFIFLQLLCVSETDEKLVSIVRDHCYCTVYILITVFDQH